MTYALIAALYFAVGIKLAWFGKRMVPPLNLKTRVFILLFWWPITAIGLIYEWRCARRPS